jgi:hypothetical protein
MVLPYLLSEHWEARGRRTERLQTQDKPGLLVTPSQQQKTQRSPQSLMHQGLCCSINENTSSSEVFYSVSILIIITLSAYVWCLGWNPEPQTC